MIRQFASVAGTLGIAFVILFFNIALFLILLNLKNKKVVSATTYLLFLMIGIVIILGGVWYGQQTVHPEGRLVAAVLQADSRKSITGLHEEPYATLLEVAKEQSPSLIVMPESIFTDWEGREDNSYRSFMERSFADILGDFDGAVVFGGYRKEGEALYNSFFLLSGGKIIATYDKYYLVPFAEYSPPLFSRFSPRSITMFEKGDPGKTFQTEAYILGPALCQELVYPETTRRAVQNGAEILVSGANDGYVRRSHLLDRILDTQNHWVYEIAHTIARFRAVETGRYLLRSTKVGITSIINPAGKELIQIDSGQPGVGIAEIAVMKGITPYTRFGDFPLLALSFLLAGWGIMRSRNGKNKK